MRKLTLGFLLFLNLFAFGQKKTLPLITKKYSQFEKETSYIATAGSLGVFAVKKDGEEICSYKALTINIYDSYLTYASNLVILFDDGSTIELKTKEELGSYDSSYKLYNYYAFAYPTTEEWKLLSNKKIIGLKFHIFERKYNQSVKLGNIIDNLPL